MSRRRALFLTHEPPAPLTSGTRIRSYNLMRQLARRGWSISLFSLVANGRTPMQGHAALDELCESVTLEPLAVSSPRRYARLLRAVVRGRAFQEVYFRSDTAVASLRHRLDADCPDVIVADQLYMYPYVPAELRDATVLDCHNVELRRVETMTSALSPRPRGIVARLQRGPVRRFEENAARSVAHILAVSESELRYFEALAPGRVSLVPNGIDPDRYSPRPGIQRDPSILFVGSMDYGANRDAAHYLAMEILPRVRRPDTRLMIVGGSPPRKLRSRALVSGGRVEVTGLVPSTEPYFEAARMLAVPLRFGGGTRLKILESLARGVPVVSTSIGCEGLGLVHERELVIADDPREFAGWIDQLCEDDELCHSLARAGRATVESRFDWGRIGDGLEAAVERVTGPDGGR